MCFSILAHPLQVKESFVAFIFINLPHFSIGLTSSPSKPTKKLKMAMEKKTIPNSRLKKPKLYEDVRNSSNLRKLLCKPAHQYYFSNTVDDPIEIEEVEDPSENSEQGSACGEEASSQDNS